MAVETNRRYVEAICFQKVLAEYKDAVNETSFVSKTDLNGNITYINELFCKLSGYSKEELIGAPHSIARHPDVPVSVFKGIIKNHKKNAEAYYVQSMIKPILDFDGNILEHMAIRIEITLLPMLIRISCRTRRHPKRYYL